MALILFHSPKGGVGTTFLAAQLAMHLAARGHQVTAIDFTHQDSLKLHFGMLPSQPLADMALTAGDAMVVNGVELLTGYELAQQPKFREILARDGTGLFNPDHVTIVDVASGDRPLKALLHARCDLHICPMVPLAAALATLPSVVPGTPTTALTKTAFVLNALDDSRRLSRHSHKFVRELLGKAMLCTVRRDEAVNEALAMFEPIAKFAPSSVTLPDLDRFASAVEVRLGLGATSEVQQADALKLQG